LQSHLTSELGGTFPCPPSRPHAIQAHRSAPSRLGREPMLDGCPQPCIESTAPGSVHTPVDNRRNAQAHDFVPGRDNSFLAIAGLDDIGVIGWRPLGGHGVRALTANGGPRGTFSNDFNWLCRAGQSDPSRTGRRQPAMAWAVGIGPRRKASRRAGPRKTNIQR